MYEPFPTKSCSILSSVLEARRFSHNQPHKYLDFNIDLSELRQILCKTEFPTRPAEATLRERCIEFRKALCFSSILILKSSFNLWGWLWL
ncbi:hypothetical protein B1J94_02330 [Leptospira kirschneri serovar Grippotyphosa]|nr:hypothetical protein B1J94_02330 [Leptospira kirschneri serovar Grippotyphosa]